MVVGKVGSCGNLQYDDRPVSNLLADRVIPYVNMLDSLVLDRIASQVDCNFSVFVNWDSFSLDTQFKQ
jgi:hypothetical protein